MEQNSSTIGSQSNGTTSSVSQPFAYIISGAFIVITIVTIVGNLLVCYAIVTNRMLRRIPTNTFIFSLALSDLLTAVIAMTFDVDILLKREVWTHGEHMCRAWTTIYLIGVPTSIWTLLAVSIDRYKTLSDPLGQFKETRFMTRKRALLAVTCIWLYCVIFSLVPVFGWREWRMWVHQEQCYFVLTSEFSALSSFLNFIVPLLGTCAVYIKIYLIARNRQELQECSMRAGTGINSERRRKHYKDNLRAAKTISLIIGAFFFCWVPYCVMSIVLNLQPEFLSHSPPELTYILLMCGYLNCALNPFLYSLLNRRFKTTYTRMCRRLQSKIRRRGGSFSTLSLQTMSTRRIRLTELREGQSPPNANSSNESTSSKDKFESVITSKVV